MGQSKRRLVMLVLSLLSCLNGCSVISNYQQLKVLSDVGKSQKQISQYLDRQEKGFFALLEAVQAGQLKSGMLKEYIIKAYGEPVIEREVKGDPLISEELLYRHPTEYFSSDKIYLYFDHEGKLIHWRLAPSS